jgi:hypothetical protein
MTPATQWLAAAAYWRAQQHAREREGKWTEAGKARREADECERRAQRAQREEMGERTGATTP